MPREKSKRPPHKPGQGRRPNTCDILVILGRPVVVLAATDRRGRECCVELDYADAELFARTILDQIAQCKAKT